MSMTEIFEDYNRQVLQLHKQIKGAAMREKNLNNELARIAEQFYEARTECQKLDEKNKETYDKLVKLEHDFSHSDIIIKDLKKQISAGKTII